MNDPEHSLQLYESLVFSDHISLGSRPQKAGKEIQLIPSGKIRDRTGIDTKDLAVCLSMSLWNVRLLA